MVAQPTLDLSANADWRHACEEDTHPRGDRRNPGRRRRRRHGCTASAAVVCNRAGDCWHVDKRVVYPRQRFEYHPDSWYFHQKWEADKNRRWHEHHDDRGYYENGAWVPYHR